jgi:hypothetical protein
VVDHHVDRLRVQAQQCVQLRSTNHPFGLIFYFSVNPSFARANEGKQRRQKISKQNEALKCAFSNALYVGIKELAMFFDSDE